MKNVIEVISKRRTENQGKENEEHGKQYDPAHGTV